SEVALSRLVFASRIWLLHFTSTADFYSLTSTIFVLTPHSLMTDYSIFPVINATLNGCSAILLITGRIMIGRGKIAAHRAVMLTALATSSLFLVSYLYYHAHVGSMHFRGTGWSRPVYYTILTS